MAKTQKQIGTIASVNNTSLTALLHRAADGNGAAPPPGCRLGSFVVLPEGDRSVIGTIIAVRQAGVQPAPDSKEAPPMHEMEIQLIGTLLGEKFERSVSSYPLVGGGGACPALRAWGGRPSSRRRTSSRRSSPSTGRRTSRRARSRFSRASACSSIRTSSSR